MPKLTRQTAPMKVSYDAAKRSTTLNARGLDFEDAALIFEGPTLTIADDRRDYGETRFQTYGLFENRLVMIVWTPRPPARHVISMRHCHEREARKVRPRLVRPG
ncbi:BrnT family toxin [Jiella pacifica]|nr:BrnT family toxin [Jiella pacifica]